MLDEVRRAYEKARRVIASLVPPELRPLMEPETLYYSSLKLLDSYGPLTHLAEKLSAHAEIPVHVYYAPRLDLPPDEAAAEVEEAVRRGARGVKIISTLFMKFLDDPVIEAVLDVAQSLDVPVVMHSGCDPGVWELPRYCRYGDPARLEKLLPRYREVRIVLAHVGAYSAIAPGVFMEEAARILRNYPNVYADVSALSPGVIEAAARAAPRGKLMFGTDYPVINSEPGPMILDAYRAVRRAGYSRSEVESFFRGLAEEVHGLSC
jgi:hypothetical protein